MATFAYFRVASNVELEGVAGIRDSIFLCSVVPFPIGLLVFFLGYTPHTPRYGSTVGPSNPTEQSSFLALSEGLGYIHRTKNVFLCLFASSVVITNSCK